MSNVVFLEVDTEDRSLVSRRFANAAVFEGVLAANALVSACKDAEAISCFIKSDFTADTIRKLPKLRLLCTRSVGYDHIDLDACRKQGITVCNVPDYGSHVVAEHVFALLLSTLRHIPEGQKKTGEGIFDYHGLRGMALRGKTIGIVGTGKIGRCVATIAHGFDMKIIAVDQCRTLELTERLGVQYVTLDVLLKQSDIITLNVPDTKETEHMVDALAFRKMKKGVILVNTARGGLIDSRALIDALKNGTVGYALLDVLEHEQNFAENKELVANPKVVTTPHIAFYADDSMRNMYLDTFQSIETWQADRVPAHVVTPVTVVCDLPKIRR